MHPYGHAYHVTHETGFSAVLSVVVDMVSAHDLYVVSGTSVEIIFVTSVKPLTSKKQTMAQGYTGCALQLSFHNRHCMHVVCMAPS